MKVRTRRASVVTVAAIAMGMLPAAVAHADVCAQGDCRALPVSTPSDVTVGPLQYMTDPDTGETVVGQEVEAALADQAVGLNVPQENGVTAPSVVSSKFDTADDAYLSGDLAAAGSAGNYSGSCNPSGNVSYQYTPKTLRLQDRGIAETFTVVPYQRNDAHFRPDTLQFTYQVALCGFGGAKTYNGWRLMREGIGVSLAADGQPNQSVKIAQDWDTAADGNSSGSVSFQVAAGPASVGASIGTGSTGKNAGDAGVQGPQTPDYACRYSCPNAVHGYWENSSPFYVPPSNRGVTSFRGSVDLGLYEMGENTQPSAHWTYGIFYKRNCTLTRGCDT